MTEEKKKNAKQDWEYTMLYCTSLELEFDENKEQVTRKNGLFKEKSPFQVPIDPKITIPANQKVNWQMAKSEISSHWTRLDTALNELAEKGWRVVTVTPAWSTSPDIVGPHVVRTWNDFHVILERKKV